MERCLRIGSTKMIIKYVYSRRNKAYIISQLSMRSYVNSPKHIVDFTITLKIYLARNNSKKLHDPVKSIVSVDLFLWTYNESVNQVSFQFVSRYPTIKKSIRKVHYCLSEWLLLCLCGLKNTFISYVLAYRTLFARKECNS